MDRPPTIDYATPRVGRERADGFAVAAAWCGLGAMPLSCLAATVVGEAGFALAFLAALAALVCGVVGLMRTAKLRRFTITTVRERRRGNGLAWLGTLAGAALVALAVLMPSMGRARPAAQRIKCGSNLRQIAQAMRQYAVDDLRRSAFPPDFETLLAETDLVSEVFICPSSDDVDAGPPLVFGVNCSYHYLGTGLTAWVPAATVVAVCDPRHHDGEGANVAFADGTVQWLDAPELFTAVAGRADPPATRSAR